MDSVLNFLKQDQGSKAPLKGAPSEDLKVFFEFLMKSIITFFKKYFSRKCTFLQKKSRNCI